MGDPRWPHLPEVLAARFEAARALGTLIDAVEKIAADIPVQPGMESYRETLQHHVQQLKVYVAEARLLAEREPPTIGMPSIPEVWTAAFDSNGRLWLHTRRRFTGRCWTPNQEFRHAGERGNVLTGDELIYEFGPIEMAVDPRG